MKIIRDLVEKIDEELTDAEKYIDCAYKVKDDYPDLSAVFFRLSKEEMVHMQTLHDQVVRFIELYKKDHEVPADMKALYDYLHEKQVEWSLRIEFKQKNYK
jgi:rubrerythrin